MADLAVIGLLVAAVGSGIYTLHRNEQTFKSFAAGGLFAKDPFALLYAVTVASTSLCFIDSWLRFFWAVKQGWDGIDSDWAWLWLGMHAAYALFSILLHGTINTVLSDSQPDLRPTRPNHYYCKTPKKDDEK